MRRLLYPIIAKYNNSMNGNISTSKKYMTKCNLFVFLTLGEEKVSIKLYIFIIRKPFYVIWLQICIALSLNNQ